MYFVFTYMYSTLSSIYTYHTSTVRDYIEYISYDVELLYTIYVRIYEGCSKFFHLENVIFAKNFRELHVFLSRYMLAKIFKKNVDV